MPLITVPALVCAPGATSEQSHFFHSQNISSLLCFNVNEPLLGDTGSSNFRHSQHFLGFTTLCFLFYIPLRFSPGNFPPAQMNAEDL